jgi:hypothetical protein
MHRTDTSEAPVRAYPLVSELFPDATKASPPYMDWPTCPVLLVQFDRDYSVSFHEDEEETSFRPLKPCRQLFKDFLRGLGLGEYDVNIVHIRDVVDPHWGECCFKWPRNLRWKALPVAMEPDWILDIEDLWGFDVGSAADGDERRRLQQRGGRRSVLYGGQFPASYKLLTGVGIIVLDTTRLTDDALVFVGRMLQTCEHGTGIRICHFDGKDFAEISLSMILGRTRLAEPEARFAYSYEINAVVLMNRALYQIALEEDISRERVQIFMPRLRRHGSRFGHPLSLQVLHWLDQNVAETATRALFESSNIWATLANVSACPFYEVSEDGKQFSFVWKGTGKYPEWRLGPFDTFVHKRDGVISTPRGCLWSVVKDGYWNGLVGLTDDGRWALTRRGRRFLELIGRRATCDLDVMLRWRTADGRLGSPGDVPAMDRWLNRVFRSVKRHVAGLPASPFTETQAAPWREFGRNAKVVRGWVAHLDQAAMEDGSVRDAVARLVVETGGKDWRTANVWVEERYLGIAARRKTYSVWAGVPLGIFGETRSPRAESYPWNRVDFAPIDEVARRALDDVPEPLVGLLAAGGFGLHNVRTTSDEPKPLIDVVSRPGSEFDDRFTGRDVFCD